MSIDVTIVYPDADSTAPGEFFLPSEPVRGIPRVCSLCEQLGDWHDTHSHQGVVVIDSPQWRESVHLRCLVDTAEQFGSIGMVLGNIESFVQGGRHAASV